MMTMAATSTMMMTNKGGIAQDAVKAMTVLNYINGNREEK